MHYATKILLSCFLLFNLNALGQKKIELPEVEITEDRILGAPTYNGSAKRLVDVIHTELELRLDWEKHAIYGQADVYLKAYNKPLDTVVLDAQGFKIIEVSRVVHGIHRPLGYRYDGTHLHIAQKAWRDTVLQIFIDYVALPDSLEAKGGAAIRDAKGFYFIDETPEFGRHFWTQGEPESNSAWFPTIDKPNERITTRIGITVDEKWQTLSNGRIEFQTLNGDGTRTDYWLMEQPHAPYLVMLAGGDFDTIGANWQGIPVRYFVEPDWQYAAERIFGNTLEMLTFFSDKLGVKFPWPKYDQIVVRNYVSGAMENTTASVFGEFMYTDERAYADNSYEDVVSHELFHQWFGDLVTCESWAQLPLNESFATYGEVIWKEHKYGQDEADFHSQNDLDSYLNEYTRGKSEKMIRFEHKLPLEMFDSHSYAKGGRILHMLRDLVGDEDFFSALQQYLTTNAYSAVEISDLRKSFEVVTGQDLTWFFDQWFKQPGHPKLTVTHAYNKEAGLAIIKIEQTQDPTRYPIYRLPTLVDVYTKSGTQRYEIEINKQIQEFSFEVDAQPLFLHFDPNNTLLADINLKQTDQYWMAMLGNSKKAIGRYKAASHLIDVANANLLATIAGITLRDSYWELRVLGLESAEKWDENGKRKLKQSVELLLKDTKPEVRAAALRAWSNVYQSKDEKLFEENLNFISYQVNEAALEGLMAANTSKGMQKAIEGMTQKNDWGLACMMLVTEHGTSADVNKTADYANQHGFTKVYWYMALYERILTADDAATTAIDILVNEAKKETNPETKMYAAYFLTKAAEALQDGSTGGNAKRKKELSAYIESQM